MHTPEMRKKVEGRLIQTRFIEIHQFFRKIKVGYEVWQKRNETDFLFTKVFYFFKHQCYPLQNSSLEQLHTDGDVPTFDSSAGSLQPVWFPACPLHSLDVF